MDTKVYFRDFKPVIIECIKNAKISIKICMSWLSDEQIIILLQEKIKEIDVKIIMGYSLTDETNKDLHIFALSYNEKIQEGTVFLKTYDPNQKNVRMHNKYCIIDNEIVLTGSLNWTHTGLNYNDENLIVINNSQIAKEYSKDFESHFSIGVAHAYEENLSTLKRYFEDIFENSPYQLGVKVLEINFKKEFIIFQTFLIKHMAKEARDMYFKALIKKMKEDNDM